MKQDIMLRDLPNEARLAPLVRRLVGHVEKQAIPYWQRTGVLHAVVQKYPTRARYRVSLVLSVPRHTLVAHDEGRGAEKVLRAAFLEIERQLRKEKSRLRREHVWKRRAHRTRMRSEGTLEPVPRGDPEPGLLADLVLANLEWLYTVARREVAYHAATGDLARDDLGLDDLVHAVVLRACAEFRRRPAHLEVRAWLNRLTVEQLGAELERLGRNGTETVHVEDAVPAAPPGVEIQTLGEEIYDFYQPDESLRLEDVVPDRVAPTPDRVAECHALECCLTDALAGLPPAWRIAFELHYVDEVPIADVARVTRQTETQVRGCLDSARALLRERIAASGFALSG
jgi:RNA polymerase sigma factor (sigma-70 family)